MIEAEKIRDILNRNAKRMTALKDEKIGGFILLVAPDGQTVEQLMLGTEPSIQSFYNLVADKCKDMSRGSQSGLGAINAR